MDTSSPDSQALPQGTHLHEFVIERVLGSGGFGITYLARDTVLGRQVVIKENLPIQFCIRDTHSLTVAPRHTHGGDADNFQWSLENFSKEAAILASLDHPGIVRVHRSFQAFGTAYFVMPFVEGVTLDELANQRNGKPFSEEELRGLLERVLGALGYMHDRGIYHRDIKPGNILITTDGLPMLIDFGSARQRLSERSMTVIESAGYTPFEQLESLGNVGPWSDIYALGSTLEKAITSQTPPKAMDRMRRDPRIPLADRPELASAYSSVFLLSIDQALQVEESRRWQDAAEWLAGLWKAPHPPTINVQEETLGERRTIGLHPQDKTDDAPNQNSASVTKKALGKTTKENQGDLAENYSIKKWIGYITRETFRIQDDKIERENTTNRLEKSFDDWLEGKISSDLAYKFMEPRSLLRQYEQETNKSP